MKKMPMFLLLLTLPSAFAKITELNVMAGNRVSVSAISRNQITFLIRGETGTNSLPVCDSTTYHIDGEAILKTAEIARQNHIPVDMEVALDRPCIFSMKLELSSGLLK